MTHYIVMSSSILRLSLLTSDYNASARISHSKMQFGVELALDRNQMLCTFSGNSVTCGRKHITKVSRKETCNGCWVRAGAFELWTLCPTDFDFPKGGFS